MKTAKATICAAALTLTLSSTGLAGTIVGARASRTGTIVGARAGTIVGARSGNIAGTRTGNIAGTSTAGGTSDKGFGRGVSSVLSENFVGIFRLFLESTLF